MIEKTIESAIIEDLKAVISEAKIIGLWQEVITGEIRQEPPLISVAVKPMYPPEPALPFFDIPVVIDVIVRPEFDSTKSRFADWSDKVNGYVNGLVMPNDAITALDGDGYNVTGVTINQGDAGYDGNDDLFYCAVNFTVHITKC